MRFFSNCVFVPELKNIQANYCWGQNRTQPKFWLAHPAHPEAPPWTGLYGTASGASVRCQGALQLYLNRPHLTLNGMKFHMVFAFSAVAGIP